MMSEEESRINEHKSKICQLALLRSISSVFTFGVTSIIGTIADRQISKSKDRMKGRVYTVLLLVTCVVVLVSLILINCPFTRRKREPDWRVCMHNLVKLSKAMYEYAGDYDGQYPTADKWCDLLVDLKLEPKRFVCRSSGAKIGESSYALNKNIEGKKPSEIPSNTVLLFEAEKGWNQVGGPELLTLENHDGEACSVLFGDLHVEFVKKERVANLKWRVEEDVSESVE